jgi:uncharacterized protein (DUF4415 family)
MDRKRGFIMDMMRITLKAGQKPAKEQIKKAKQEAKEAAKLAPVYDPDCARRQHLRHWRKLRRRRGHTKAAVTLRIDPDCLDTYKSLGSGYTGIMADVLNYAATHPEFLKQAL